MAAFILFSIPRLYKRIDEGIIYPCAFAKDNLSHQPSMNSRHLPSLLKALFAVVVWGASFIATKIALRELSPMTIVWLRFGIGVVILAVCVVARKEFSLISKKEFVSFSFLGFLGITFHQWLQSNGLLTAQATTTAWIVATTPIFIALLGWFILKETLRGIQIGGMALAVCGVLLVVTHGNLQSISQGQFGTTGDLLVLISALNWAVFSVLSRRSLKRHSATNMMLYVMGLGWLFPTFIILIGQISGIQHVISLQVLSEITVNTWIAILFLGVFCSGFAYIFWYDALKDIPASRVGAFLYIEPVIAVVAAAILLQERIILTAIIGGILILVGVWLVNRVRVKMIPHDHELT